VRGTTGRAGVTLVAVCAESARVAAAAFAAFDLRIAILNPAYLETTSCLY
jgi:hypothetical protein